MKEGIEIHFHEKTGCLELACAADAFAAYRELARADLAECTEVPLGKVVEIYVVDADAAIRRRQSRRVLTNWIGPGLFVLVLGLAIVGLVTIVAAFMRLMREYAPWMPRHAAHYLAPVTG